MAAKLSKRVLDIAGLTRRVPLYYGWVIVGCAVLAAFARQGSAVATLSVFINPMSAEFGWSRTAISGAVSLGGVLAAVIAPWVGTIVDRHGARVVLSLGAVVVGLACLALSFTTSLVWFYVAFAIGRLTFASPFDIGISSAIARWFVRRRAQAMSYVTVGSTLGLAAMPMLAFVVIDASGWRMGWIALGVTVLVVGAIPNAVLMRRRPEDFGLAPDGAGGGAENNASADVAKAPLGAERQYTRAQALRTPALWLLMAFSVCIYPVQAGISLHQAPHLIEQGMSPAVAASVVSTYSLFAAVCALGFGIIGRWWPIRFGLALAAAMMAVAAFFMITIATPLEAYLSAALFGGGIGGVMTLLPVAWANYFGREHFGAIRGITLPVQVLAQAIGPLLAGVLYDAKGSYTWSLVTLGTLAVVGAGIAMVARPPKPIHPNDMGQPENLKPL
ncbi:MAG: OFA family oxalate/formate antiporter-like MFS transporter [Gammaproteobacteria bacterium]